MSLSIQNPLRRPSRRLRPYKIQRWDSAAVSLKGQRRQYRSIQRNTDKVILCWVIRLQHDRRQISPAHGARTASVINGPFRNQRYLGNVSSCCSGSRFSLTPGQVGANGHTSMGMLGRQGRTGPLLMALP